MRLRVIGDARQGRDQRAQLFRMQIRIQIISVIQLHHSTTRVSGRNVLTKANTAVSIPLKDSAGRCRSSVCAAMYVSGLP